VVAAQACRAGHQAPGKGLVRDLISKQLDVSKPYTSCCLTDDHKPIVDQQLLERVKARFESVDQERKTGICRNS